MTYYKAGLGNAASYQASGAPFVTGSASLTGIQKIEFPTVTKEITVHVLTQGKRLNIYFNENSPTLNQFIIDSTNQKEPLTLDIKCKELYVAGTGVEFRVYASLTGILPREMFDLTGSGITK